MNLDDIKQHRRCNAVISIMEILYSQDEYQFYKDDNILTIAEYDTTVLEIICGDIILININIKNTSLAKDIDIYQWDSSLQEIFNKYQCKVAYTVISYPEYDCDFYKLLSNTTVEENVDMVKIIDFVYSFLDENCES